MNEWINDKLGLIIDCFKTVVECQACVEVFFLFELQVILKLSLSIVSLFKNLAFINQS